MLRGLGLPVADAEVSVLGRPGHVLTDADGRFVLVPTPRPPFDVLVVLPGGRHSRPFASRPSLPALSRWRWSGRWTNRSPSGRDRPRSRRLSGERPDPRLGPGPHRPRPHEPGPGARERGRGVDGLRGAGGGARAARPLRRPDAHPARWSEGHHRATGRAERDLRGPGGAGGGRGRARAGGRRLRLGCLRGRHPDAHAPRPAGHALRRPVRGLARRRHPAATRRARPHPGLRARRGAPGRALPELRRLDEPRGRRLQLGGPRPGVPRPLRPSRGGRSSLARLAERLRARHRTTAHELRDGALLLPDRGLAPADPGMGAGPDRCLQQGGGERLPGPGTRSSPTRIATPPRTRPAASSGRTSPPATSPCAAMPRSRSAPRASRRASTSTAGRTSRPSRSASGTTRPGRSRPAARSCRSKMPAA